MHGDPIRFTDDVSIEVESADGFVHLVTRDADGEILSGLVFAPSEAQQLGQNLLTAAFGTNPKFGPQP